MTARFDAIIIGAGQAGPALAGRLTSAGMTVALVERHLFGGTCVNTGCTPTKAMVASAYAAHLARRAADYGVRLPDGVSVDFAAVMARKDAISGKSRDGVESWLRGMERCSVYQGHARFASPREVSVGDESLTADRIFLNVGGRALAPDMLGLSDIRYLTNSSILRLQNLPRRLVVIGGSYIGLEFAQMFRRFGSEVTVIEKGARLASREDEDVSDAIGEILEREGVEIRTGAECIRFEPRGEEIAVGLDCAAGAPEIVGDEVLLAIGRRPNTDDLDVEKAGVELDGRGYVKVDDELRTTAPNIWALGDCNGRGAFTHTAYNDFEIVAANLLDGASRRVSDRIPAYALYTDPPLGRVGLTEAAARAAGYKVRVGVRPMTRVARAVEKGETAGFMKIVVDAERQEILGAAILGVGGDEAIHGILDVMNLGAPYPELEKAVPIHPTVSELIPTVLQEALP
ncbi:FAD-containing oxidoreductase [Hansschlegelia sp.]|uniref:FAD-containing oxidoreductase n=1 Tax=Hansschlegelia sp. TaxID=2041892 RepID=UPI002BC1CF88|nr:FAD-containing oxidoreductase [Hansschlegelia sp.]HVI29935.1 FAD-containing oxidoreductase [Hansschlegelia sp.]